MKRRYIGLPFTGLASILVGLIQVLWSLIPWIESGRTNSLFVRVLKQYDSGNDWLAVMFLSGVLLCAMSVLLFRNIRHISMFISSSVLLGTFGMFVASDTVTPVTVTLPLLGVYCLLLLAIDVGMKERRKSHG